MEAASHAKNTVYACNLAENVFLHEMGKRGISIILKLGISDTLK